MMAAAEARLSLTELEEERATEARYLDMAEAEMGDECSDEAESQSENYGRNKVLDGHSDHRDSNTACQVGWGASVPPPPPPMSTSTRDTAGAPAATALLPSTHASASKPQPQSLPPLLRPQDRAPTTKVPEVLATDFEALD